MFSYFVLTFNNQTLYFRIGNNLITDELEFYESSDFQSWQKLNLFQSYGDKERSIFSVSGRTYTFTIQNDLSVQNDQNQILSLAFPNNPFENIFLVNIGINQLPYQLALASQSLSDKEIEELNTKIAILEKEQDEDEISKFKNVLIAFEQANPKQIVEDKTQGEGQLKQRFLASQINERVHLPETNFENTLSEEEESSCCTSSCQNISMQVFGLFVTAIGAAAVAVAFLVLNAASFGALGITVACLGGAAALAGFGLFALGGYRQYKEKSAEDDFEMIRSF